MAEAGYEFEVVEPGIDEPPPESGVTPERLARDLAELKAASVAGRYPGRFVLGADTVVALAESILGKPDDADDARRMLRTLSRCRHRVITGLAVIAPDGRRWVESATTYVTMRPMTEDEIESYIASGEWIGKAGAYAIQETAERYVTNIDGSFTNVVGLPMEHVERVLTAAGWRRQK